MNAGVRLVWTLDVMAAIAAITTAAESIITRGIDVPKWKCQGEKYGISVRFVGFDLRDSRSGSRTASGVKTGTNNVQGEGFSQAITKRLYP